MKTKIFLCLIATFICALSAAAQDNPHPVLQPDDSSRPLTVLYDKKADKSAISPELETKIVAFLKATGKDAASLNVPENRIRYESAAADLLWMRDENAARELFATAASDLRAVVQTLDSYYQRREAGDEIEDESLGGMFFGGGRGGSSKFYTTNTIRQNLLLTMAKRDGKTAMALFRETQRDQYKELGWNDAGLEAQIGSLIAKEDPAQALAIGERKLAQGDFNKMDELIADLYRKDPAKGAKLAAAAIKKLPALGSSGDYYGSDPALSLFTKAAQMTAKNVQPAADKPPLLSDGELRELAEIIIRKRLESFKKNSYYYFDQSGESVDYLKKYAPASYAALERAIKTKASQTQAIAKTAEDTEKEDTQISDAAATDGKLEPVTSVDVTAPVAVTSGAGIGGPVNSRTPSARESAQQAQAAALSKLMAAATSPESKISLEEARQGLNQIRNRQQKLLALTQIAKAFIARKDPDAAKSLLADVAGMQTAQPRKAAEMLQNLMLADAYSAIEPDRSLTILEATIFEFNNIAASVGRVVEFMDVKEIADGEFNMGFLPREATEQLGTLGLKQPLTNLALADFERTAALADKFDRSELRMEAKMLIARTLLPPEKDQ